jgi:predicted hydrocarbon binding protein
MALPEGRNPKAFQQCVRNNALTINVLPYILTVESVVSECIFCRQTSEMDCTDCHFETNCIIKGLYGAN